MQARGTRRDVRRRIAAALAATTMAIGTAGLPGCEGSFVATVNPSPASPLPANPSPPPSPAPPPPEPHGTAPVPPPPPSPIEANAAGLAGTWLAAGYTCTDSSVPPEEEILIAVDHDLATATKVIGDNCVPAGSITWRGAVRGDSFPIEIWVGGIGAPHHFVEGRLSRRGPAHFTVDGPGWTLHFRRR